MTRSRRLVERLSSLLKTKVVVVGYPKSGNTWLNRLLAECIGCPQSGYLEHGPGYAEMAREGQSRRSRYEVWKSHGTPAILERRDVSVSKVVYIVRDPRDVAISASHHFQRELDVCIDQMATGELARGPVSGLAWDEHVSAWMGTAASLVRYEDLLGQPVQELQRLLGYFGLSNVTIAPASVRRAVDLQSFDKRRLEFSQTGDTENLRFLRSGRAHQYSEVMRPDQQETCWSHFSSVMERLGYER